MSHSTVIANPIINSPYSVPERHFKFDDGGITNEIIEARRKSSYFVPIAQPKKQTKQLSFNTQWTSDRLRENDNINRIRERVEIWRRGGYQGVSNTTRDLLAYWNRENRERKILFCQKEAVETAIYIAEVANRYGDQWIENGLKDANEEANSVLYRVAFKMATGSGKTIVMAMLISWNVLNYLRGERKGDYSDSFLIVTPGITIRDRLRVLLPNDPQNFYKQFDLVKPYQIDELGRAKIIITNYHGFLLRERTSAGKLTKSILRASAQDSPFTETPDQMVRRVCREFGSKRNIIAINDEAHHCYRRRAETTEEILKGEERKEAEKREEEARVWISGLEAVKHKLGVKVVYDLSATPFFLKGSGYPEGTLFKWVVSDFSLVDAIESGIVKVPRVPVSDNSMVGDQPAYRDLWYRISDHLPKKGRGKERLSGEPMLPKELQGALHSLYDNYRKYYEKWCKDTEAIARGSTPPVFIVVCNNTNVSKLVYDYVAGWQKQLKGDQSILVPGKLPLFSNVTDGLLVERPNTILIDSEQLESGEAMSDEFKKIASLEIERFKDELRVRFPGRDLGDLNDEDLLREVMNTVGKPGKLGEQVKCVVSVSMLTEGWDANTVTHILGVRAFGSQLLCEQVVGRGLRRRSYTSDKRTIDCNGKQIEIDSFPVEYAEVYGVPFSFIQTSGSAEDGVDRPTPTRVRAMEDRLDAGITFPRLMGYRYEIPSEKLRYKFGDESKIALTTAEIPTITENRPIVGEGSIHTLDDLKMHREQEVVFLLAKLVLEKYFRQDGSTKTENTQTHKFDAEVKSWLFPQLLTITRDWLCECVSCKDDTFPQLLLLLEFAHDASDRIYRAIVGAEIGEKTLLPILLPYDTIGSTQYIDFDTIRPTYPTRPDKCHVSHVVLDTSTWEQKMVQSIEDMDEVICYVKNQRLGFEIPYVLNGEEHKYVPDFIVRMNDGHGNEDPLNLIIEVTGEKKKDKEAKVSTAKNLWVPAVNNHGGFGRWAFLEITDPWNAKTLIRRHLAGYGLPDGLSLPID